ncbi:hypothetical protein BGW80DRAFT_537371 [Lactifluus volemus]|nr:hypothetical protein BGW80DRAFT_537371 [Lactifluus volemus]
MDIPIIPDKEARQTLPNLRQNDDGMVDLGSQQANDEAARQSELHARVEAGRVPLSEHLEGTTSVSSAAGFIEESPVRESTPARSKSTTVPAAASGHLRPTARRGDTIELDAKADARNRSAQPSTDADDPRTQAARAIPVSKSYSRLTANVPGTTQRESPGSISRSTTSLLDEKNPPRIPVSPQNIQLVRTPRKTGGDGSPSHPEAAEASRSGSSDAHKDPHREVHAKSRTEDRGSSIQSLAGSSSSHLPWGAPSTPSFPSPPPPAAIKKASSGMRQTKDTSPGEPERRLGSRATYGRSHVDLPTAPDAVPERVAVTVEPAPNQQSSAPPRIDRSTSRFQQPNQHDTVSPESYASGTASPTPSSLPGGVIRRTGSSHPRHGSDNNASRADGASAPDTARSWGGLPPPPAKALSSPRDQPSNKALVDPSASAEKPFLSAPHDTLAKKKGETTDSASDGTTPKEAHSSSTTQDRSPKPTSQPTERHGDNLRDPPPQSHSLAVRQGQGDPSAKREQSSSTVMSREMSQKPIDSRTRTKSPSDRKEQSHSSSSQSPSGQAHTHADSASYSDTQTKSRIEPGHSESTRPEGAGGGQPGDGGREGGGISRKTTEAIHPAPTKALSSPPDQLSSKALSGPALLLDSPAKKSRDMPASSGDRTTRKEVSDSRSSVQVRTPEPPSSVAESAEAHGGKARDSGQQGGGIPKTTVDALTPPTKALSPPPEQPLNKPDANATLLGSPLKKPLDMMSSPRKEGVGLSMQDRGLQPTLPAAVPPQGHDVNLGEPLPPAPPPHSSEVRQGTGDPVAKKEPSSSMGISREKSQTPMESRARTKSPQDRIEHTHSLSSSLSRKPSTRPAPSTTGSSIPTSRSEPSHMESTRPEGAGGSGRAGGGEQQRGGIPRETTEVPPIGGDGPRTQAARAVPVSKSHSKLTPNAPGTTQRESPGFISRSTTMLLDDKNSPTIPVSPQNIQPVRTSRKTGDGSSSHTEAAEASRSGSSGAHKDPHREVHAKSRMDDRGPSVQSLAGSASSHLPWGGAPSTSSLPPSPLPAATKKTSSSVGHTKDTPPGEPERRLGSSANYGRSHVDLPTAVPERVAATAAEPASHQQSSAPPRIDRSASHFLPPIQHHSASESLSSGTASPIPVSLSGGAIRRTGSSHPRHGSDNDASRVDRTGDLPPPPKAFSPRDQPSNNVLAEPSVSSEGSSLFTPYVSPARKKGDLADSPSHGTTRKEVSHSSLTAQSRSIKPTLPAAEAHGDNLRDSPPPSHSLPVRQDQGGPAAKREPSSSMSTSREISQMPMDSHTRKKIPLDRIERSHPSSSSPSSQPHTHTDSTTYSDIPTSRTELSHSELTRQEGAEGGRQIGDGGQQRGGISRNKTEAIPPPPTTLPSLPDQPFNTALACPGATSLPPRLLDSPSKKSRDMLTSPSDRTTRTEDSSSSMQGRPSEPTFSAADSTEGHGVNLRDLSSSLSSSLAARQGQGDPVASGVPSSSISESSQTPSPPVRIEHRSRTGPSHLESMRPEVVGSGGREGQAEGGGQQGGNNMPREIRPPIATEPPRTAPMQLASLSRSGGPQEGGGSMHSVSMPPSPRYPGSPDEPPPNRCCCCLGPFLSHSDEETVEESEGSGRGLGNMTTDMRIIEGEPSPPGICAQFLECCCYCCICLCPSCRDCIRKSSVKMHNLFVLLNPCKILL